jgi:uncharacterized protein (DUF362 family)
MSCPMSRRTFMTSVSTAAAAGALSRGALPRLFAAAPASRVAIVRTSDRKKGVAEIVRLLNVPGPKGKDVVIKPNFNSADPTPGSTHNDTLRQLMAELLERDARSLTIGERSGPPATKKVMEDKGVFDLAREMKASIVNFEEIADADWVPVTPAGTHWTSQLYVPRLIAQAPYMVTTCCLKTHGFGGVYSMSVKLAVGMTPKRLMREMHGDREHMRRRIAEINAGYRPNLIVMDGVDVFVDGGPSQGKLASANVLVGGTDRVAVDAVGLAILKEMGANAAIMDKKIFEQEQLQRAIELGLGISRPDQIELVAAADEPSRAFAAKLKARLAEG